MRKLKFILWLTILSGTLNAQRLYFQEYFLLKKNEPVQINAMFQDKTGFIWFGTNKGLFKFNGKTYQRFTVSDSLQENNVTAIAQDSTGKIWVGHKSGALSVLEKKGFEKFNPREGSAAAEVSSILFDKQGTLWFSTLNDGLYNYRNSRLYRIDEEEGMPDLFVYDIIEDDDGNIWAGTDGGLVKIKLAADQIAISVFANAEGLQDNIVKKLSYGDGLIWLATEDAGIIKFEIASRKFTNLTTPWTYGSVADFFVSNEKLWLSSAREGLWQIDIEKKTNNVYHFNRRSFSCLLKDDEGNIWMGSKAGIVRTSGDQLRFADVLLPSRDNDVLAITSCQDGTIWYSTREGLFARAKGEEEAQRMLKNTPYEKFTIISLYQDTCGNIWAGLYGQGVLNIDSKTGSVKLYSKELRNGNVLSITGKGNVIWLATLAGAEKLVIDNGRMSFQNFNRENGLSSDFIYQVFIDSKDNVWFATDGRAVDMLDATGFHHYEKGLPSTVVYGFAEDSKNNIWVNVQGNGIYQITGNTFSAPQKQFKLRDNNVNCLSSDNLGNIVVMHDLGIDVLDFANGRVRSYGQQNGLEDAVATLNGVQRDQDGNLLFATDGGIVYYRSQGEALAHTPRVALAKIKTFDNDDVDMTGDATLSYDQNNLTFSFYGIWYQDVDGLQFQYMLENYDVDWITTGDNSVTYSKLPPGDYKFLVKASDNPDFTQSPQASVAFRINPPFWRTSLFYVLMLIAISGGLYSLIQIRERRLLRDKKVLEMKVIHRTQEIQRQKERAYALPCRPRRNRARDQSYTAS